MKIITQSLSLPRVKSLLFFVETEISVKKRDEMRVYPQITDFVYTYLSRQAIRHRPVQRNKA